MENKKIENNGSTVSAEIYLNNIQNQGIFAGELEIYLASLIFNISIYCYEYNEKNNGNRLLYKIDNESNFIIYCMILNHVYLNPDKNYHS